MTQTFDLTRVVRPNIWKLLPYRCARDDYNGPGYIFLDANENAYGPSLPSRVPSETSEKHSDLNRYPDPNQTKVKEAICTLRRGGLKPKNLFVGVGSDEAIDCVLRVFCRPGVDKILITPPTYGMYSVSAVINDVGVVKVPLLPDEGFQPKIDEIITTVLNDPLIKIVFFCSPGNPTGKLIDASRIERLLQSDWVGIVVVDEAYIDFSVDGSSLTSWVNSYPNLVVLQTLSKAFGLAGIRLGIAFTNSEIARIMNSLKAPYNISTPTSLLALEALSREGLSTMRSHVDRLNSARAALAETFMTFRNVKRIIGGTEANFVMIQVQDSSGNISNDLALKVYKDMAEKKGVVVRFRGLEHGCEGCLRVTVGTEEENEVLLELMERSFKEMTEST